MIKKYKVHEVAKDFDIPSKFIIEKISQYFESEKNFLELDTSFQEQSSPTIPLL